MFLKSSNVDNENYKQNSKNFPWKISAKIHFFLTCSLSKGIILRFSFFLPLLKQRRGLQIAILFHKILKIYWVNYIKKIFKKKKKVVHQNSTFSGKVSQNQRRQKWYITKANRNISISEHTAALPPRIVYMLSCLLVVDWLIGTSWRSISNPTEHLMKNISSLIVL